MNGDFYGRSEADVPAKDNTYSGIDTAVTLYEFLTKLWCAETCAPRLRSGWSKDNPTWGQCSITAFLVQDIFGGQVFGVPREGGNYHCFNVVDGHVFDLTSEQFGSEKLDYSLLYEQTREVHWQKEEKRLRYELLKARLLACCRESLTEKQ